MKTPSFFRWILPGVITLFSLGAGACGSEKEEPQTGSGEENVELELSVGVLSSPGAGRQTRASSPGFALPDYPEEALNSLRVLIVDKQSGKVVHNRAVVFENGVPQADDMLFKVKTSSEYTLYLIGNCRFEDYDFGIDKYPVGSLYSIADEYSVENMILTAGAGGELFDNENHTKREIPLLEKFDVKTVKPSGDVTQRQPLNLFITRAAAKFSFSISTTDDFQAGSSRKLTSIKITGISDRQFLLPDQTVYEPSKSLAGSGALEGRDITSFNVPATVRRSDYVYTLPEPLSLPTSGYEWNPEIYLAESLLPAEGFLCSLSFDNGESWLTPVRLPNLPYGLPRNTHAKVNITIGNDNAVITGLKVLPWNSETTDFDYSDHIGISADGALSFTAGTYLSLDKSTARLVIKNQAATKGSFGISTPFGARWDAYLITQSGEPDVIRFRLEDGSTTTHLSGTINGMKSEFAILSAVAPGSVANTARLQLIVTTLDGRTLPVNILQGGGYGAGVENLTVIQNPK
ncbi:MAG: hypothetical protein HDS28_01450 [Bacteroides sp.]|nr:hypothetical protein [Bacteroides sp.]